MSHIRPTFWGPFRTESVVEAYEQFNTIDANDKAGQKRWLDDHWLKEDGSIAKKSRLAKVLDSCPLTSWLIRCINGVSIANSVSCWRFNANHFANFRPWSYHAPDIKRSKMEKLDERIEKVASAPPGKLAKNEAKLVKIIQRIRSNSAANNLSKNTSIFNPKPDGTNKDHVDAISAEIKHFKVAFMILAFAASDSRGQTVSQLQERKDKCKQAIQSYTSAHQTLSALYEETKTYFVDRCIAEKLAEKKMSVQGLLPASRFKVLDTVDEQIKAFGSTWKWSRQAPYVTLGALPGK